MVKRNKKTPTHDIDRLPTAISDRNFPRTIRTVTDELIHSLSGAYENERARQVGEWERAQANSIRHGA